MASSSRATWGNGFSATIFLEGARRRYSGTFVYAANQLPNVAPAREGVVPHEIGAFVRSAAELDRARAAVENAKLPYKVLDDNVETTTGRTSISTMHLAKGLEFRSVVVMACDDEVMPLQERIETVADDADLEEVYNRERHLLYFACTRARDHLLVTGVEPASEFLDDLR
jgi:superfamily I DNA/RNA helicase